MDESRRRPDRDRFCTFTGFRQGDETSVGPVGDSRIHEAMSHTCLSSSAEYELALILKELRWITDQVSESYKYGRWGVTVKVIDIGRAEQI